MGHHEFKFKELERHNEHEDHQEEKDHKKPKQHKQLKQHKEYQAHHNKQGRSEMGSSEEKGEGFKLEGIHLKKRDLWLVAGGALGALVADVNRLVGGR